jgi:hypothetical protein
MSSFPYRDRWTEIARRPIPPEDFRRLSRRIASSFMDAHLVDGHGERDHVALLCEMATFDRAPEEGRPAAQALFGGIVEGLCDELEEVPVETYNRVMAQVITFCRRLPAAARLDRRLLDFGIRGEADLLARMERVGERRRPPLRRERIDKILILSRVTVGADIAVTGVILQRLRAACPRAEIVLLGGDQPVEIFGAFPGLRFRRVLYRRDGGLLERLDAWHDALAVVAEETAGLSAEAAVLVDPDSRLSQLGVLPLIDEERYLLFGSRAAGASAPSAMSALANAWMDGVLGETGAAAPGIFPAPQLLARGRELCRRLKAAGARRVAAVNFGVGGNRRKRVGRPLEDGLIRMLLAEPDTVVLLDRGAGEAEAAEADRLLETARAAGAPALTARFEAEPFPALSRGLIAVTTRIGEIAALIAASDEYLGYDSAGQHIAAAAGTPGVTVFAGSNNRRFIRRWRACGAAPSRIVHVDTLNDPGELDIEDILARIANERAAAGRRT